MNPMSVQMRSVYRAGHGTEGRARQGHALAGALSFTLALLFMLLALFGLATRAGDDQLGEPAPLAAPAPVSAVDFPEQAYPLGGCLAVLNQSAATWAPRAEPAVENTVSLTEDACFGA